MSEAVNKPRGEHCLFLEKFADGSVYYSAKKRWSGSSAENLRWAKSESPLRPLVAKYLKYEGEATRTKLADELSRREASLLKSELIKRSEAMGQPVLNTKGKINATLTCMRSIKRHCDCDFERANTLIKMFNKMG